MPTTPAAPLAPGELERIAVTVTDHPDRTVRRAAAVALRLLQPGTHGTGRGAAPASAHPAPATPLPSGARRITAAQATALAARRQADEDAAWDAFTASTFGADR